MDKFDLIILGSGPAGYSAAMRAYDFGKHVCIIEKKHLGGVGVMHGALTSKALWELSVDFAIAAAVDRGYRASGLTVDYAKVRKSVVQSAKSKQYQMLSQIETFSPDKSESGSLTLIYGTGKFLDRKSIEIELMNGGKRIVYAEHFVIATGSRPKEYPGIVVDQKKIFDSDGILRLHEFPERLMIIGSGIIGTEFATIFSNFKQTEVHLLDRAHRVIPFEDDDVSDLISENLAKNGVIIHHTANLRNIRPDGDAMQVVLDYEDGHSNVIEVDAVLISIGRVPNTDNIGLENVGIVPDERGNIGIDEMCCISGQDGKCNIWAAGDVTGYSQLYSVAELQGRYIAEMMYADRITPISYANMSTLMFFKPEVASVGFNEKMLQKSKTPYKVVVYHNSLVNRTIAMRSTDGFIKILLSDDGTDRIIGMRAIGPQASAFIVTVAHLLHEGIGLADMMKTIHPHPSVTEGIQEALRVFNNKSIFKPKAFPNLIKTYSWKPENE